MSDLEEVIAEETPVVEWEVVLDPETEIGAE
jgi:hypothetical protein